MMKAMKKRLLTMPIALVQSPRISRLPITISTVGSSMADGRHDRFREDPVGADGADVAGRVVELGQAGQQLDATDDEARQQADPLLHDAPP